MPKKKYFLTQAELSKLLKNYGGGYRFKLNKRLSQSGNVTYTDVQGGMLSINQLWDKDTDKPYVMVHISDSSGRIYRKDKWDWFDTIKQLHFDWTLQNGNYDLEFKNIEGDTMAKKKRQSLTQKLEKKIADQRAIIERQNELITRMQANGEDSFLNSPTYMQMEEKITFLDNCNKLSELGRVNAEGRVRKFDESDKKVYEDNKAFLEHDGDSDYFIGIIECYKDINEVRKYKDESKTLEGKIQGYKDIIAERDKEIERLQGIVADLKHEQPATTPSEDMQRELDEAIRLRNLYKDWYDEEKDKSQKLSEKIENLELQLMKEPSTDYISDDKLDLDSDILYDEPWYRVYEDTDKPKLIRRFHFEKTISKRRQNLIKELEKQVNDKKYAQYVQEDAITYNMALDRMEYLEVKLDQYEQWNRAAHKKNEELQRKLTELATTSLTPEESVQVIEENIAQKKELKKPEKRKQGRPNRINERQRALIVELSRNGHSIRDIASQIGCSVGSVCRILKEEKEK